MRMKDIIVKELTRENFQKYGEFCNMLMQGTDDQSAFFPDRLTWQPMAEMGASVGYACPCEMRISWYESHAATAELRLPLDGDMVIYVGAPSEMPDMESFDAFVIPQGTMIRLNPGVVHGRQFPLEDRPVHVLLLSEAATWENDAKVWRPAPENQPLILLK